MYSICSLVFFPTFYKPEFNQCCSLMIMLLAIFVVFAEHWAFICKISDIVGKDLIKETGLHRSLSLADGYPMLISGLVGSNRTPPTVRIWCYGD